jgi:hypothetical protein
MLVQFINNSAVRGLAMKYFLKGLIMVVVPLAIMSGLNVLLDTIIDFVISKVDVIDVGGMTTSYQLTGMAAYMYVELGLDTAMAAVLSGFSVKFCLRSIPFLHL